MEQRFKCFSSLLKSKCLLNVIDVLQDNRLELSIIMLLIKELFYQLLKITETYCYKE